MKISYVSDLHVDGSSWNLQLTKKILNKLEVESCDVIIILGDISSKLVNINNILHDFSTIASKVIYVPGNHDIEVEKIKGITISSSEKYYYYLHEISKKNEVHYLANDYLELDDLIVYGCMGWCDYSFYSTKILWKDLVEIHKRSQINKKIVWYEDHFNLIGSDPEIHQLQLNGFEDMLDSTHKTYQKGIYATHFVPFIESLDMYIGYHDFYGIAFEGSHKLGSLIKQHTNVKDKISIHGHAHNNNVSKRVNDIEVRTIVLGGEEIRKYGNVEKEVNNAIGEIII